MKKIIVIVVLFITSITYSQKLETQDWITDLNFLKTELAKKHKNLFFKISEQDFNKEIDNIIAQLDNDTDVETAIKLTQLIAKIGDTHTNLSISHLTKKRKRLPLGFMWFKDGLYISGTSKENYELLDKKLLSINGYKTETIIDSLKTIFVAENIGVINENTSRLLGSNTLLKYFGFSKSKDSIYKLELSDKNGNISTYQLSETENSRRNRRDKVYLKVNTERPFYMNGSRKPFKEKYYENERIYFIQYNKCISRETIEKYGNKEMAYKQPSFKEFENKVLKTIKENKIDKLIFDMRFNKGGSSYLAENLIEQIAKNKKLNKKGKLFVVVGNKTFSSAIINTINFKENTKAIIIGEKTGGKPNHYGNIKRFTLPYSKIKVVYSQNFYKLIESNENTITPEIIIERTYNDFKNGIDPIFEWVKNYEK
jgi:hypothetical protein